jgi:molybdenum-dependent DNA-binding transcriptional regulator ModE
MSGARPFRRGPGSSSAVPVFSKPLVEQMATRKSKGSKKAKGTRKGKRALTPWNKLVMKVYHEMKAKDKTTKFSAALKAAAKRKSEM